jgi:hypothetical protein
MKHEDRMEIRKGKENRMKAEAEEAKQEAKNVVESKK